MSLAFTPKLSGLDTMVASAPRVRKQVDSTIQEEKVRQQRQASGKLSRINVKGKGKPDSRGAIKWTEEELCCLVELRSYGFTFDQCAEALGRTLASIKGTTKQNDIYFRIQERREEVLHEVLDSFN